MLSVIGAIVQHTYLFMNVEMDGMQYIMPVMVIVVCLLLVMLSKNAIQKGWLK